MAIKHKGLYLISPEFETTNAFVKALEPLLSAGVGLFQYRCKTRSLAYRVAEAKVIFSLCRSYDVKVIVNDDIALAEMLSADGVHLGRNDASLKEARDRLGNEAIVGCSCYSDMSRIEEAIESGANQVALGAFFVSKTKPEASAVTPEFFKRARKRYADAPIEWVGIGGITLDNAPIVLDAGAQWLAIGHDLFSAKSPEARIQAYNELLRDFEDHT